MQKPNEPTTTENSKINPVFTADAKTFDGFDNFASRLGLNNDNALSAGTYTFNLITRNRVKLEAAYRGSWIVGAIVDTVAEDMTRAGIDITTNESKEDINDLKSAFSKHQVWGSLASLTKWGRLYGGAIAVIQIKGQRLDTPLDISTVTKDQFDGLVVYDRWQLNPDQFNVIQSGPEMGLPKYYSITTNWNAMDPQAPSMTGDVKVHHSRVIRSIGIELPYMQAITEMMWGESVIERLYDRLIAFDNATMSTASLVDRANLRTVGIEGLREIIAAGGKAKEGLVSMFEMMRLLQVNEGITLLDKNDSFASTAYTFSGLSDVLLQFGQQISGACGIPLIRLFGQAVAGLSGNSEGDIRLYYDNINAQQEVKFRKGVDQLLRIMWRSTFGVEEPKDMQFTFTPLWQMSAADKAINAKTTTETVLGAYESGVTTRATSLKELRQSSADTGIFTNITDEDIAEAEAESKLDEPPSPELMNMHETKASAPSPEEIEPVKNLDAVAKVKAWFSKK